ncbi:helix-turn-helix domain-containing protein [Aquimarina algicola]|uniref:XRE family transcriptional regulator n=1 Tax=Aquimarina algicola TaxID=2589995 RepID=A0A504JBT0_9FLAO|nr:XRE family transcriptional regulator [Aquimarina algicola]TPN84379.1 XRE family transcriptional regulator [Aquimarina algicola]
MASKKEIKRHKAIGNRIKELRIQAGYTSYTNFAIEHNLENKSVWRWEAGVNYRIDTLCMIAEIHGITVSELLKDIQ